MADVERMYVNGEWVLAQGGATFDVVNPADRTVIARMTNGAVPEVERAVTAAHAAFRDWAALAPKDRATRPSSCSRTRTSRRRSTAPSR